MSQPLPSKTFCILPWIHFFHSPSGGVQACCAANQGDGKFGNINDFDNVQELMNSESMRQLRIDMLAGRENSACTGCYREERIGLTSFRQNKNTEIDSFDIDQLLDNTATDGTLSNFKMGYWDSRFSNVCNFKCRMCGPEYSHSWAEEAFRGTNRKDFVIRAHGSDDWADIIAKYGDLTELAEVYFAGGEALYQREHWLMLDHLEKIGKHDIKITYTTNLSRLSFGTYRIEDYLTKFTNVLFIVSLDAVGPLVEYIRSGCDWARTQDNIKSVLSYPHTRLKYNVVITAYNILHLAELFEFAVNNTTNFAGTDLTVAHGPPEQNITNLPDELKNLARDRLLASPHYPTLKNKIDGVINYMFQSPVLPWATTVAATNKLDRVRNENVLSVVPEFEPFWDSNV